TNRIATPGPDKVIRTPTKNWRLTHSDPGGHMIQHARLLFAAAFIAFAPHNARAASEIVIGQVAPFSGPLAPTGEHMRAGAQIYFDRINAEGGIHGAKLRLVTKDDGYKISETVRLTR